MLSPPEEDIASEIRKNTEFILKYITTPSIPVASIFKKSYTN
jgi:hypothetical protein